MVDGYLQHLHRGLCRLDSAQDAVQAALFLQPSRQFLCDALALRDIADHRLPFCNGATIIRYAHAPAFAHRMACHPAPTILISQVCPFAATKHRRAVLVSRRHWSSGAMKWDNDCPRKSPLSMPNSRVAVTFASRICPVSLTVR